MCEALRELMKDEIEQDVARGEMRGRVEGIVDTCCDLGLPEDAILERLQKKTKYIITDCPGISKDFWKTDRKKINERQENQKTYELIRQKDLVRNSKTGKQYQKKLSGSRSTAGKACSGRTFESIESFQKSCREASGKI